MKRRVVITSLGTINAIGNDVTKTWDAAKLGKNGVEQIIELKLTAEENAALKKSAEAVRELAKIMKLE